MLQQSDLNVSNTIKLKGKVGLQKPTGRTWGWKSFFYCNICNIFYVNIGVVLQMTDQKLSVEYF